MHKFLVNINYICLHTDNSVFMNSNLIIALYIDDILICRSEKKIINKLNTRLSTQFNMMDCGSCKHYLEMQIMRDRTLRTLTLSQKIYLKRVLKDFDFLKTKAVTTSMKPGTYHIKTKNIATSQLIQQYQSNIDSLMYIMTQTHPNIIYTMLTLSQHSHNSDETH